MRKKILLLGAQGMAGHVISLILSENTSFEVVTVSRKPGFPDSKYIIDITDFEGVSHIVKKEKPSVVVNCIGILNSEAENNPDKAVLLNAYLPHFLARICRVNGAQLIHISTDCVFSGKKGGYVESDTKDGIGFYAQTKALGEVVYGNHLTIRTSIIGPEIKRNGIGLLDWFLRAEKDVKGFTNAIWSGVTTIQLAKSMVQLISEKKPIVGLVHLTNNLKISKFELLTLIRTAFNKENIEITKSGDYHVDKSLLNTRIDFQMEVPDYETMINEMKDFMDSHHTLYSY